MLKPYEMEQLEKAFIDPRLPCHYCRRVREGKQKILHDGKATVLYCPFCGRELPLDNATITHSGDDEM